MNVKDLAGFLLNSIKNLTVPMDDGALTTALAAREVLTNIVKGVFVVIPAERLKMLEAIETQARKAAEAVVPAK